MISAFKFGDSFPSDSILSLWVLLGLPFLVLFLFTALSLFLFLSCACQFFLRLSLPPSLLSHPCHPTESLTSPWSLVLQLTWSLGIAQMPCYSGLSPPPHVPRPPRIAPHVLLSVEIACVNCCSTLVFRLNSSMGLTSDKHCLEILNNLMDLF